MKETKDKEVLGGTEEGEGREDTALDGEVTALAPDAVPDGVDAKVGEGADKDTDTDIDADTDTDTDTDIDAPPKGDNAPLEAVQNEEATDPIKGDIPALLTLFPQVTERDLADSPARARFGELRAMGLTAEEAFLATHRTLLEERTRKSMAAREAATAHLHSIGRRGGGSAAPRMNEAERAMFSEFLPHVSERELEALFARTQS